MSRERELLQRVLDGDADRHWTISSRLYKKIEEVLAQPEQGLREDLREGLREDLREEISLRDATNDGLRKEIASLRTANDRLEADLMLAKTALAETMKLFNNQPNDSGLRDHFAGLAMQSLLTKASATVGSDSVAMAAYHVAHQMLKERSRGEKSDD